MSNQKSMEDYLESILILKKQKGSCRSVELAAYMNFSKPSISIAIGKLEASGHVMRSPDGQLNLTPLGESVAMHTLEKHRFLMELFQKIGVSEETAREDACNLEHSLSKESYEKLKAWLEKKEKNT